MAAEAGRACARIAAKNQRAREELMAKKSTNPKAQSVSNPVDPQVAATLAGIIYQARLFNRQARVNVPEEEVVVEVISLWRIVMDALASGTMPGLNPL
jgi:hypothetical protein